MSFARKIIIPRFGGLNRIDPPHAIEDHEAQVANDVRLARNRLEAREFRLDHGPPKGTLFTKPIRFFHKLYTATDVIDVLVSNGAIYRDYASVGSGFDTHALWGAFIYNGLMYMSSTAGMRVVGPSSYTRWGINAPSAAPDVATGATGVLDGAYEYKVTFYNSDGVESDSSPASDEVSPSDEKVDLTNIPTSSDSQVVGRYIYRIGGLLGKYVRIKDLADNSTTSYSDNMSDEDASTQTQLDVDNNDEPAAMPITVLKEGRAYYAGNKSYPNRLYYSESLYPEYSGNFRVIGGYEALVALGLFENVIFIWKEGEIFAFEGSSPSTANIRRLEVKRGTSSPFSVAVGKFPTYVYWDGIYSHDGYTEQRLGHKLHDIFDKEVNTDQLGKAVGTASRQFYVASVAAKGEEENSLTFVYNYDTRETHTLDFGCTALWTDQGGAIYAGCKNPAWDANNPSAESKYRIYKLSHPTNTFDEVVNMNWKSKRFFIGENFRSRGAVKNFTVSADTKGELVEVFCWIDNVRMKAEPISTTKHTLVDVMLPDREGFFCEIEFKYTGKMRPEIHPPLVINPEVQTQ